MTAMQLETALLAGHQAVERALTSGAELFIGGEMGIGNSTAAAAVACALLGLPGRALAGRAHVLRGALDEPLAPGGQTRMDRVVAELEREAPIDVVCASPLRRCLDFARPWAAARGLALAVAADFRERDFGAWEGLTHAEVARLAPEAHARYLASAGGEAPPGGEGLAALRARVETGWRAWLADARGGHRLLVTHAGVMRVLLMDLLGLPPSHAYRLVLPWAAHFQVSVLAGHPPVLLNLNPCAA